MRPRFLRRRAADRRRPSADELERALEEPDRSIDVLFDVARAPEESSYDDAVDRLEAWPPRLWFRLDGARLEPPYRAPLKPPTGWRPVIDDDGAPALLLVLACTHHDGLLREAAVRALATRREQIAAAALAVRAFDHVAQVRDAAQAALLSRSPEDDASIVTPILHAGRGRSVARDLLDRYLARMPAELVKTLIRSPDRDTRRFAVQRAQLSVAELVDAAASDRDVQVQLTAARRALADEPRVAGELLALRSASVRALAVTAGAAAVVAPDLERLLLDRSALLRRAAQQRAGGCEYDARALYRASLPMRTAVLGLGETGGRDDADRLLPLVHEPHAPAVRRAALVALGRLASADVLRDLLPPFIYDDEPAVAREAGRQLRRIRFTLAGAALDQALDARHVWTRRAALRIVVGSRGWDVPVAALALYDDEDDRLRESAHAALGDWLARRAATAGNPSPEQAGRLDAALARSAPAEHLDRLLRFHAGLHR